MYYALKISVNKENISNFHVFWNYAFMDRFIELLELSAPSITGYAFLL